MVALPHVLSVYITLVRRVLPLLLMAKVSCHRASLLGMLCLTLGQSTGSALKLPGRFSYSHVTQNKARARDVMQPQRSGPPTQYTIVA